MNIAWCQATGVYAKIMEDVVYISKTFMISADIRSLPKIRTGEALSVTHLIPPFILLAIGLLLSTISFCVEKGRQKAPRAKNGPSNQDRWGFPPRQGVGDPGSNGGLGGGGQGGRHPNWGQAGRKDVNQGKGGQSPNAGRGENYMQLLTNIDDQ